MKHLRQKRVWKECMVLACGTDSASGPSMLGVHSLGTWDLFSDSSMYLSISSGGVPMSGKMEAMAEKTFMEGTPSGGLSREFSSSSSSSSPFFSSSSSSLSLAELSYCLSAFPSSTNRSSSMNPPSLSPCTFPS